MFNSISNKGKVYKGKMLFTCPACHPRPQYLTEKPWIGLNPQLGARHFDTQRQAFDWAKQRPTLMNDSVAVVSG